MCKKLHEDGLLTDALLPRRKILPQFIEEMDLGDSKGAKIGTKRSKSYYKLDLPPELSLSGESRMLYKIDLTLKRQTSLQARDKKKYAIYDPKACSRKLGLVVGDVLPQVVQDPFTLYNLSGSVQVQMQFLGPMKNFLAHEKLLGEFHCFALSEVIGFNKDIVQPMESSNDPFIVPLNEKNELDLDFLFKWKSHVQLEQSTQNNFRCDTDKYLDAVVIPTHHDMGHFIVEEIVLTRSPGSLMPNSKLTFAQYYKDNYGCDIQDLAQPMLRISNADKRHFMLSPLGQNPMMQEASEKSYDKFLDQKTLLVPELVKIHSLPASLWRELQMLPFVFHRLTSLIKIHTFLSSTINHHNLYSMKFDQDDLVSSSKIFLQDLLHFDPNAQSESRVKISNILEAVTLKGAGETFDMEKLETLGDSFLKYSITLSLFVNKVSDLNTRFEIFISNCLISVHWQRG